MTTSTDQTAEIGSVWRRWDLHIHTPASFHWKGQRLAEQSADEQAATWKTVCDRLNEVEVDAFCVMDYWTFDGYISLRKHLAANPTHTTKRVFPGIELRLEAPTNYRLNTHVIFDDSLTSDSLNHFVSRLSITGPNGRPPSRETFIDIAKAYDDSKLRTHGFQSADRADDSKMLLLGMQTALVTRESLQQAIEMVGKERCLLIQPYDTSDGLEDLDWKRHPYTDSYLMRMAHIFETRDPIHVNLFLGNGHPTKPSVGEEFLHNLGGMPKPVVSGSDAHRVADYGVYPSDRATWLKAQPTFAGLRQVCNEPSQRCFIGPLPPKRDHVAQNPTKYIRHLSLAKVQGSQLTEIWFDGVSVPVNPGLVAIIGNKGSGKSAIADIIALAGNTHCTEMEFLNDERFRRGENKARHFVATLKWEDGNESPVTLSNDPDLDQPERVRYLPQQYIENLCNEIASGNETNFERELKKVIFSHVPEDRRLGKASLDELIDYIVDNHRKAASQLQAKLRGVNADILAAEKEMSEETLKSYRTALSLKQTELDAHEKAVPETVPQPAGPNDPKAQQSTAEVAKAQAALTELTSRMDALKAERVSLAARQAAFERLLGHLNNFEAVHRTFVEDHSEEFAKAGFTLNDVLKVSITTTTITDAMKQVRDRLAEIAEVVSGKGTAPGLELLITQATAALDKARGALDAEQKRYQAYLVDVARWQARKAEIIGSAEKPESIEFLKGRIQHAERVLPNQLASLREQRLQRVREIHAEMLKVRNAYRELYRPVEEVAEDSPLAKGSLDLSFDAFLSPARFEDGFLEFIHRNRIGHFQGDDESRKAVRAIVGKYDFNDTENAVAFVAEVMTALTDFERGGIREPVTIQSQLRANKKLSDLYDFLFGLPYLEPRYTLKLGDKDIGQLSPGEKGALLLVFYLLLDPEQIPIIIDQPEQNLDNESVVRLLVDCIRQATAHRQVIIVTHNPNLAVVCDADQIMHVRIDKADGNRITIQAGAIEDYPINKSTVDVLEGTYRAFNNRGKKYHKPVPEKLSVPVFPFPSKPSGPEQSS